VAFGTELASAREEGRRHFRAGVFIPLCHLSSTLSARNDVTVGETCVTESVAVRHWGNLRLRTATRAEDLRSVGNARSIGKSTCLCRLGVKWRPGWPVYVRFLGGFCVYSRAVVPAFLLPELRG
jgi:hypothetical protein